MNGLLADIRLALRSLIARPAHSALTVSVLGAGLACVVFMMALINGFVLRPLPFVQPEALMQAGVYSDEWGAEYLGPVQGKSLLDIRRRLASTGQVAGFSPAAMNVSDIEVPERDYGAFVTANLFSLLGVAPILGRDFSDDDQKAGAPAVVILSYTLWHGRYGGDPSILGRQVRINAKPATVIGVMPADFSFPIRETLWMAAHLFDGMGADETPFDLVVRRSQDASDAAVRGSLESWFQQAVHSEPERFLGTHVGIGDLRNITWGGMLRQSLYVMFAAVFLLLLIACANAANLMLSRMLGRTQEIAVRLALGATRARLMMYLLMESVILSLAAVVLALSLAAFGVHWLVGWFRANDFGPAHWQRFDLDATVIVFAIGAAILTALATGLPPVRHAINDAIADRLRSAAQGAISTRTRLSGALVIVEVALSCTLLISVSMMVQAIDSIDHTDIGIKKDHLFSSRIVLSSSAYPTDVERLRLYERLTERLRSESGVLDVTIGTAVPGTYWNQFQAVLPAGEVADQRTIPRTAMGAVDDGFLSTYGISLREGRFFDERDASDRPRVAVVDRRFVEKFSADRPVLGRQFHLDPRNPAGPTVTVVGVISNIMLNTQQQPVQTTLLVPARQAPFLVGSVAIRTGDDSAAVATHLNKVMRDIDADIPLAFHDYESIPRSQTKTAHLFALAFDVLGVVSFVLVGAGMYGVMAVNVKRRTHEIGVRRALGAPNQKIYSALFTLSAIQMAVGLILGFAAGIPLARLLDSSLLQFGNSTRPAVLLGSILVIVAAAALAMLAPARRATRIDPIQALHFE